MLWVGRIDVETFDVPGTFSCEAEGHASVGRLDQVLVGHDINDVRIGRMNLDDSAAQGEILAVRAREKTAGTIDRLLPGDSSVGALPKGPARAEVSSRDPHDGWIARRRSDGQDGIFVEIEA